MYCHSLLATQCLMRRISQLGSRQAMRTLSTSMTNRNATKCSVLFVNANKPMLNNMLSSKRLASSSSSSTPTPGPPKKRYNLNLIGWRSFIVVVLFGTAFYLFMLKLRKDKEDQIRRNRKQYIGKMAIGGPFELVDHTGKTRTNNDFLGQWLLIYFGFTHCPDICPEEMDKIVHVVDIIDKVKIQGQFLQPLFITVDPDRDDVKNVARYIKDFSTRFIGLTGSREQIDRVTKAYRVYFSAGPQDDDKDYIVDHTVIMYLVDPEGNFVDYFGQNKKAEEIATATAIHMNSYEIGKKQKAKEQN